MKLHRVLTLALALNMMPALALCQDTTVSFSGTIGGSTGIPIESGGFTTAPTVLSDLEGQDFLFNFSFDSALPDLNTPASGIGNFAGLSSAEALFGGNALNLNTTPGGTEGQIEVNNDGNGRPFGSVADRFTALLLPGESSLSDPTGVLATFDTVSLQLILEDSDGGLLDSDALITDSSVLENLDNFDIAVASLLFGNESGTAEGGTLIVDLQDTSGTILSAGRRLSVLSTLFPSSIVAVPEPTTGMIAWAVMGGVVLRRRRNKLSTCTPN